MGNSIKTWKEGFVVGMMCINRGIVTKANQTKVMTCGCDVMEQAIL